MLSPEQMNRVIIVGSKENLKKTIDVLYESEAVHLVDFPAEEQGFTLGAPLPEASDASQRLLKLRALEKDLELTEESCPKEVVEVCKVRSDCDSSVKELDSQLGKIVEQRTKAQSRISEIQNEKKLLEPFFSIDIPLELYRGYSYLAVSTGHVKVDPNAQMRQVSANSEAILSKDGKFVAAFYPKKDSSEIQKVLVQCGFVEVPAPVGTGMPSTRSKEMDDEAVSLQQVIEDSSKKLEELQKKYGCILNAADEQLSIDVQIAETPLRLGTTEHAFVIDGWVPQSDIEKLQASLTQKTGGQVYMDVLEVAGRRESHEHDTGHIENVDYGHKDETPTKQNNNKTVKKFEFLTEMISTPKYNELDPSFILAITFPIFFGLMVGDVGFGLSFLILGALGLKKCTSPEWRTIATMLFFGGLWATIFGFALFGEALGMHFGPVWTAGADHTLFPYGDEITWSWLLHMNLPHMGFFSKLVDVKILLFISLMIGFAHLGIGFGLGMYNKARRFGLKHAVMEKFSWLMILVGGWFLLIYILDMLVTPLDSWGLPGLDYYLYLSLILILPGVIMAYLGEGGGALLELPGLMSNVMSYTRLTAIAMSKAGLAFAFIELSFKIIGLNGINAIFAIIVFVVGMLMVFILGIISAGMHSIRLHYVELFQKFYEGGGVKFNPLRIVRKWTKEKAGE